MEDNALPVSPLSGRSPAAILGSLLAHPLLLLLVGASISAVLVPFLTQRWQDHQRALDVQTALVADMTNASETVLEAVNVDAATLANPQCQGCIGQISPRQAVTELNASARAWGVRSAVIRSRLRVCPRAE
jgi:hypothetical protein